MSRSERGQGEMGQGEMGRSDQAGQGGQAGEDDQPPVAPHPTGELSDDDLFRELEHVYATRVDTLRRGSDSALEHSDRRIQELEQEYFRRHPHREVSPRRLRPDESSLTPPRG